MLSVDVVAYRWTGGPSHLIWSEGRQPLPLGAVLHSSDKLDKSRNYSIINIAWSVLLLLLLLFIINLLQLLCHTVVTSSTNRLLPVLYITRAQYARQYALLDKERRDGTIIKMTLGE